MPCSNVPPGTVVENFYTKNDSYIITHRDLQGTKRPTRYVSIGEFRRMIILQPYELIRVH
jgi:hypothetical protein